jgi:AbrB family looped-hinge helix DNA binding protein
MDITLTITAKGQVTLKKEVLEHLGLGPGDRVKVELLGPGRVELSRPPTGSIEDVFGSLPNNGVSLSIEEINDVIAAGWSRV